MKKVLALLLSFMMLISAHALADMQYFLTDWYESDSNPENAAPEYDYNTELLYSSIDWNANFNDQIAELDLDAISNGNRVFIIGFERDGQGKPLQKGKLVINYLDGNIINGTYTGAFSYHMDAQDFGDFILGASTVYLLEYQLENGVKCHCSITVYDNGPQYDNCKISFDDVDLYRCLDVHYFIDTYAPENAAN